MNINPMLQPFQRPQMQPQVMPYAGQSPAWLAALQNPYQQFMQQPMQRHNPFANMGPRSLWGGGPQPYAQGGAGTGGNAQPPRQMPRMFGLLGG